MRLPNEFITSLLHQYDAAERHEYYLRNRELKGKPTAQVKPTGLGRPKAAELTSRPRTSKTALVKKPTAPKKSSEQRRKEIEAKVEALKGRLETLRKVLAELVKQAKARSGAETNSKTPASDSKLTDKQKAAASKRSKEYYEKHKDEKPPEDDAKALEAKIKEVEAKIKEMRAKLAKAMKHKPSTPTAARGRIKT